MMHLILRAAIAGALLLGGVAPRAAAQGEEQISPSITLWPDIDPIEDTDNSRFDVWSGSAPGGGFSYPAQLGIRCFGIHRSGLVAYEEPVVGATHLVWRFDDNRPDTLELRREHPMRVYDGTGVWMVMYRPLKIVTVPDSVLEAMVRDGARASRLVVRLVGPRMRRDSYFSLTGFSRAANRLSCLRPDAAAKRREWLRALPPPDPAQTIYYDQEYVDVEPVPLDSAGTVAALRRALSAADLEDDPLGHVLAYLELGATGQVDSVNVLDASPSPAIERFLRSLRFRPGQVDGEAVPTRIAVYIQRYDPRQPAPDPF